MRCYLLHECAANIISGSRRRHQKSGVLLGSVVSYRLRVSILDIDGSALLKVHIE